MRDYVAFQIGQHGEILGSRRVQCDNDNEAVSVAYATTYSSNLNHDCRAVEVWNNERMVTRVVCRPEPRTRNQPPAPPLPGTRQELLPVSTEKATWAGWYDERGKRIWDNLGRMVTLTTIACNLVRAPKRRQSG